MKRDRPNSGFCVPGIAALLCVLAALGLGCRPGDGSTVTTVLKGFQKPTGLHFDRLGNLYIAEQGANRIIMVTPDGDRVLFAEGVPAPAGLALDRNGALYVEARGSGEIWKFARSGKGECIHAGLASPIGLLLDRQGLLVVEQGRCRIVRLTAGSAPLETPATPLRQADLPETAYRVPDLNGRMDEVRRMPSDMDTTRLHPNLIRLDAGAARMRDGGTLIVDPATSTLRQIRPDGTSEILASGLPGPAGLTLDRDGHAWVACWGDGSIRKIALRQDIGPAIRPSDF
ncbi:MAG: hypothetical protein V3573_08410 [Desulfovibrionaceae bacterium]